MNTNRIIWIDYIKAMAIMLVILLHIAIPNPYRTIIYSFIIPIFFVLSGLFACPDKYSTHKQFFKQKTLRLLIPYILFTIVTYFYWLLIARHQGEDACHVIPFWRPLLGAILGIEDWMVHCKPLWFLPCLMLTEFIFYTLDYLFNRRAILLFFVVIGVSVAGFVLSKVELSLPCTMGGSMSMMVFYYIGYWIRSKNYLQLLHDNLHRCSYFIWIGIAILMLGVCAWLSVQTRESRVFENTYGNLFYALPAALCGCIGMISLGLLLYRIFPNMRFLQYIGKHTMTILALHLMVAGWIKGVTYYVLHLPMELYDSLWMKLLFMVVITIACLPLCYVHDRLQKYFHKLF